MKKRIVSILVAVVLVFTMFAVSASAAGVKFESRVASASFTAIQPIGGSTPQTNPNGVKFKLQASNGTVFDETNFRVRKVSYLSWSDADSVNFGKFVTGQDYLVTVEIEAKNYEIFDHYFYETVQANKCTINGVTAAAATLIENKKVLSVSATLRAVALYSILDFGQVAPGMSAADEARHQTDLGDIEYGEYTMFGYDYYPLTQAQKDMGYTVEEKIYVNQGGGTIATRNSGTPFDLMMYVTQMGNPLGNWSVLFNMNLYQNGVYVTSLGHLYTLNIVPAVVSNVSMSVSAPAVNTAPDNDLMNILVFGEGYEVTDIDWTDTEGIIMPDQTLFESGKIYECVLQVETLPGYVFPANKAAFSGKINGMNGVISANYYSNKAYVTVQFSMTKYGDVDGDGEIKAADALLVLKTVVGKATLTEGQFIAGDVDGNEQIAAADALNILKKVVGKIDKFPVEQ